MVFPKKGSGIGHEEVADLSGGCLFLQTPGWVSRGRRQNQEWLLIGNSMVVSNILVVFAPYLGGEMIQFDPV